MITETWLKDSMDNEIRETLHEKYSSGIITRNREAGPNGVAYGGVSVVWKESFAQMKELSYKNPDNFEVLTAAASLRGLSRKLVTICCYIPPNYLKKRAVSCMDHVVNIIVDVKRKYQDPYILVGGDFNQWKVDGALADFVDLKEVEVGNTRGGRSIDRIFTNMSRSITDCGTLAPLETEGDEAVASDHRIAYCGIKLHRREKFTWEKYSYRHYTKENAGKFKEWAIMHDWKEVLNAVGSDKKAELYQKSVEGALERCFPLKTTRRKNTDLPWMNKRTLEAIKDRKELFVREGGKRTDAWKEAKKGTSEMVRELSLIHI